MYRIFESARPILLASLFCGCSLVMTDVTVVDDAGADTDADTDSDTDVDSDSDTDSDTDTGPIPEDCVRRVVAQSSSAERDGKTWGSAFTSVAQALEEAHQIDTSECPGVERAQVWVAAGRHQVFQGDVTDAVELRSGVDLYGGFAGSESSLEERDWRANITVLDGKDESSPQKVRHVVEGADDALIDGFVITGGDTTGQSDPHDSGGGFYSDNVSTTIENCVFTGNIAQENGGGLAALGQGPIIRNSIFTNNFAKVGAGLALTSGAVDSGTLISNTVVAGNLAEEAGGGILLGGGNPHVSSTVIAGNVSTPGGVVSAGGGVVFSDSSSAALINCTIVDNYADVAGAVRMNNSSPYFTNTVSQFNASPQFESTGSNPSIRYSFMAGTSLCIEGCPTTGGDVDFVGHPNAFAGSWSSFLGYDSTSATSAMDAQDTFQVDELVGKLIRVNAGTSATEDDQRLFVVQSNTTGEIRVWGDAEGLVGSGVLYEVVDLGPGESSNLVDEAMGAYGTFTPPMEDILGERRYDDPGSTGFGSGNPPFIDIGAYERTGWVRHEGDTFMMGDNLGGSSSPIHSVVVGSFDLYRHEVTRKEYGDCVNEGVCTAPSTSSGCLWPGPPEHDRRPVACVDWVQARDFCVWIGADLPSEAQWEFAARSGGSSDPFPWGTSSPECTEANFNNSGTPSGDGCGTGALKDVCSLSPGDSDFGVCDLLGNVSEWVLDGWHDDYNGAPSDGSPWGSPPSPAGVSRGGHFQAPESELDSRLRTQTDASQLEEYLGFRCARPPKH